MEKDKPKNKPNVVEKYDRHNKEPEEGKAPNNPATNNNVPFDEGQLETEKEAPRQYNENKDK